MKRILLVDNYDSFTYNLYELLSRFEVNITVSRNDQIDFGTINEYDGIVISPGPGTPDKAGDLKKLIAQYYLHKPILGICLGMQAIAEVTGCELELMDRPLHGFSTAINCEAAAIFEEVPKQPIVGRYHSWIVSNKNLSDNVKIIARDQENRIMALRVKNTQTVGFQFHPESILTTNGETMVANFLTQLTTK